MSGIAAAAETVKLPSAASAASTAEETATATPNSSRFVQGRFHVKSPTKKK